MKIIKNPNTNYLILDCKIILTNEKSKLIKLDEYIKNDLNFNDNNNKNVCFVIDVMSKGDLIINYNTNIFQLVHFH